MKKTLIALLALAAAAFAAAPVVAQPVERPAVVKAVYTVERTGAADAFTLTHAAPAQHADCEMGKGKKPPKCITAARGPGDEGSGDGGDKTEMRAKRGPGDEGDDDKGGEVHAAKKKPGKKKSASA